MLKSYTGTSVHAPRQRYQAKYLVNEVVDKERCPIKEVRKLREEGAQLIGLILEVAYIVKGLTPFPEMKASAS